jgi:hypothetical protein
MIVDREILDSKDVVYVDKTCVGNALPSETFRVQAMLTFLDRYFHENQKAVLVDGLACEVLREDGGGWKSGSIRIDITFIPDNQELLNSASPLDDIRGISS